jgi:hypothetical protein
MSDELVKRIEQLEAELAELKAQLPPPKKEFVPSKPWQPIDYTENFRLPADAAQKMAAVVPDPPKKVDMGAWARNRIGDRGGFGPGPAGKWPKAGPTKVRPEEKFEIPPQPWSGWTNPNK